MDKLKNNVKLPVIGHLQFAVLEALRESERPGRLIRESLTELGVRQSGPAFYQMMARLEDAGLVAGRYDQKVVDGQIIKERAYRISPEGKTTWKATREFYLKSAEIGKFEESLAHA